MNQNKQILHARKELPDIKISNEFKDLRILGLVADKSACGYYRIILPLHLLKMHGAQVTTTSVQSMSDFMNHDVILAPRQHSPDVLEVIRMLGWSPKRIFFEIDDDLSSVLPTSPAFVSYHQGSPELLTMSKIIKACDGLTCTTPEIAKWYTQYNQNVSILENYIDFSCRDWGCDVTWPFGIPKITPRKLQKPEKWQGKIVISWSGGSTHQEDLLEIGPDINRILREREDVVFAMYSAESMMHDMIRKFNWPADKVDFIPPRHFMDHPEGLEGIDIGLAPILPCQFNMCKSHLKLIEGMAYGAAMIGSNFGPYTRFERRHPGQVLTVGNGGKHAHKSWYSAIMSLINDPEKLKSMQETGRQLIIDEYSLERNFRLWPIAWNHLAKQSDEGLAGPPSKVREPSVYKSYGKNGRNDKCWCGSGEKQKQCCGECC